MDQHELERLIFAGLQYAGDFGGIIPQARAGRTGSKVVLRRLKLQPTARHRGCSGLHHSLGQGGLCALHFKELIDLHFRGIQLDAEQIDGRNIAAADVEIVVEIDDFDTALRAGDQQAGFIVLILGRGPQGLQRLGHRSARGRRRAGCLAQQTAEI